MCYKDQQAIHHCLAAIVSLNHESNQDGQVDQGYSSLPLPERFLTGLFYWLIICCQTSKFCCNLFEVGLRASCQSCARMHRILRFCMGSNLLPIEQGCHLRLPCQNCVRRLCHIGAFGEERRMLLQCPGLADLRGEFCPLATECSGDMGRLMWARNQPMVSRSIIACLDRISC